VSDSLGFLADELSVDLPTVDDQVTRIISQLKAQTSVGEATVMELRSQLDGEREAVKTVVGQAIGLI
jgi:hypothetical protein